MLGKEGRREKRVMVDPYTGHCTGFPTSSVVNAVIAPKQKH